MRPVIMAAEKGAAAATGGGSPPVYDPDGGDYAADGSRSVSFTLSCSEPVVWNWSASGSVPSSNVPNGGTSTRITFTLTTASIDKSSVVTVTSGGKTWTINLTVSAGTLQ